MYWTLVTSTKHIWHGMCSDQAVEAACRNAVRAAREFREAVRVEAELDDTTGVELVPGGGSGRNRSMALVNAEKHGFAEWAPCGLLLLLAIVLRCSELPHSLHITQLRCMCSYHDITGHFLSIPVLYCISAFVAPSGLPGVGIYGHLTPFDHWPAGTTDARFRRRSCLASLCASPTMCLWRLWRPR